MRSLRGVGEAECRRLSDLCLSPYQTRYKESWSRLRDGGYKLRLDALPFQAAKASSEVISDVSIQFCGNIYSKPLSVLLPLTLAFFCLWISYPLLSKLTALGQSDNNQ